MTPELRVVCFGDLAGEVWGSMLDLGEPAVVFSSPAGVATASGVTLIEDHGSWRLSGDGLELTITAAAGHDETADELCQVAGAVSIAGHERTVECLGIRNTAAESRLPRLDSVRGISGWFDDEEGVTVLALRPAGSRGQEDDLVAATVFGPEGSMTVDEPRISTTYRGGNHPARATLELWVGDGDEQYPHRAAAEAAGDGVSLNSGGLHLQVTPLRCHTRGLDGAGVYLLAQLQ